MCKCILAWSFLWTSVSCMRLVPTFTAMHRARATSLAVCMAEVTRAKQQHAVPTRSDLRRQTYDLRLLPLEQVPCFEDEDILQVDGLLAAMEDSDVTPGSGEPGEADGSLDVAALKKSLADLAGAGVQARGKVDV